MRTVSQAEYRRERDKNLDALGENCPVCFGRGWGLRSKWWMFWFPRCTYCDGAGRVHVVKPEQP